MLDFAATWKDGKGILQKPKKFKAVNKDQAEKTAKQLVQIADPDGKLILVAEIKTQKVSQTEAEGG